MRKLLENIVIKKNMNLNFKRADPMEMANFDPNTKRCTMNCGPHVLDPRSNKERKFLCEDCETVTPQIRKPVAWMWEMHGWVITAHGKHRGVKRYVDLCQPPIEVQKNDDFVRLVPLYEI